MKNFLREKRIWPFDWRYWAVMYLAMFGILHALAAFDLPQNGVEILLFFVAGAILLSILNGLLAREHRAATKAWMNDALCQKAQEFREELDGEIYCGVGDSRKGDR